MATELGELEARIRRLEEMERARNIFYEYASVLDDPRPAVMATLFTPDGVLGTPAGRVAGRAAIEAFFADAFAADPSDKRHFVLSPRTTWSEPGSVRVEAYFTYVGRGEDRSGLGWGTYDATVDVTGECPLFAKLTIDVHLASDLAAGWALPAEVR